jgi:hypothetical protein
LAWWFHPASILLWLIGVASVAVLFSSTLFLLCCPHLLPIFGSNCRAAFVSNYSSLLVFKNYSFSIFIRDVDHPTNHLAFFPLILFIVVHIHWHIPLYAWFEWKGITTCAGVPKSSISILRCTTYCSRTPFPATCFPMKPRFGIR